MIKWPSLTAVVFGALLVVGAATSKARTEPASYYLSLGDSLSVGYQPNGVRDQGYADQLRRLLLRSGLQLSLVKLGCSGESTASMRFGSLPASSGFSCGPPGFYRQRYWHGTQLAEAVAFLREHRGSVSLVTIDIGANDLLSALGRRSIEKNLPPILASLRNAAGPGVPIVGMNYNAPLLASDWKKTHDLGALRAGVAGAVAFNDFLEALHHRAGVEVADVESAFRVTDTTPVHGTPRNVALECRWTWICAGPPLGPDIHLKTAGYGVVARAFLRALGRGTISRSQ